MKCISFFSVASARSYFNLIRGKYPESDPEDLISMINALALVWAKARRGSDSEDAFTKVTKRDYRFAAKVFCVLFHSGQPTSLPGQIKNLTRTYRGISKDMKLHMKFRKSISIGLLSMCKDSDAVLLELSKQGISGLFRL